MVLPSLPKDFQGTSRQGNPVLALRLHAGGGNASALVPGNDGRIYVQRLSVQGGYPVRGPEWLVFDPAGDLLGRVDIPRSLRVLAFGRNTVLVKGTNDLGVDEVRVHAMERR